MATDKMYDLAFQYKKAKLWKQVSEDDIFAVKLSDGEIGYCVVYGMWSDSTALDLHIGDKGYKGCCLLREGYTYGDMVKMGEILASLNCLQFSLENKDDLSDDDVREVQRYAKAHQITLRGRKAFPKFVKYQPGRQVWQFDSELDERRMSEALSAGIYLSELLSGNNDIGLDSDDSKEMLLLTREDDRWIVGYIPHPAIDFSYPEPLFTDELMAAKIKRKRKAGVWECGTIWLPTPYPKDGHKGEAEFLPLALICAEQNTDEIPQTIVTDVDEFTYTVNKLAKNLLDADVVPRLLRCGDDRSFALLKDFCKKTGIHIERADNLRKLNEGRMSFLRYARRLENMDVEEISEMLLHLSDEELAQIPQDTAEIIRKYGKQGRVPQELLDRMDKGRPK